MYSPQGARDLYALEDFVVDIPVVIHPVVTNATEMARPTVFTSVLRPHHYSDRQEAFLSNTAQLMVAPLGVPPSRSRVLAEYGRRESTKAILHPTDRLLAVDRARVTRGDCGIYSGEARPTRPGTHRSFATMSTLVLVDSNQVFWVQTLVRPAIEDADGIKASVETPRPCPKPGIR